MADADSKTLDTERIYAVAARVADELDERIDTAERELTVTVLAQLLASRALRRAAEAGRAESLCGAVQAILRAHAPADTVHWLELCFRILPPPLVSTELLAQSLMISAVARGQDLTAATIATSAVSGKLAGLIMASSNVSADDLADRIGPAIRAVQDSLNSTIVGMSSPGGEPN